MAVPRFLRRQTHHLVVAALALAGLAAIEPWPASSQSRAGSPTDSSATSHTPDRGEPAAARLLATARQDLAQGYTEIAQRVLEQIIARYPEGPAVAEARRELHAMNGASHRTNAQPPAGSRSTPQPQPQPLVSAWRTTVIHFAKPQEELRNGIGDRVFFSAGSADLGSRARAVIAGQAEWLQHRPDLEIVVEGHADDSAAGADDESLSSSRATAVRDRLAAEGVAPTRIRIAPQGSRDPIATCDDGACAPQNRRVVLQVALPRSQMTAETDDASGFDMRMGDRPR